MVRATAALVSLVLIGAGPAAACPPNGSGSLRQGDVTIRVLVPGDPTVYHIRGQLSWHGSAPGSNEPVQVLVAGMSYDHNYWDFPYGKYSYVRASSSVTFNYDQLGTTESADHPPMDKLSLLNQAEVLDQVVLALKSGVRVKEQSRSFTYRSRGLMIVAGHSLGAAEALVLAATHPTHIDGVIATDYLHYANPVVSVALGAVRVPAQQTAKYEEAAWTAGSVTTADGHRDVFYYQPGADPAVIALDEQLKAVSPVPTAAQAQYLRSTNPVLTSNITVPVLLATGEYDSLNCNASPSEDDPALDCSSAAAVVQREKQFFAGACLRGYVQPDGGHDMNLHRNAGPWFRAANSWVAWLGKASHKGHAIHC
ncbi:MAG TPA: alpha/beta hydrolase [Candidatus Saccharimonadales bacterium]|nr:alpha/beta hydrolase [Candidatus Saccharimonadales bacterium]